MLDLYSKVLPQTLAQVTLSHTVQQAYPTGSTLSLHPLDFSFDSTQEGGTVLGLTPPPSMLCHNWVIIQILQVWG